MKLITHIQDAGKGIEEERQKFLFKSFAELRKVQSLDKVKDYGIGIGLSNSRELARKAGGDVILLKSQPGCTIFQISIPIEKASNQLSYNNNLTPLKNSDNFMV